MFCICNISNLFKVVLFDTKSNIWKNEKNVIDKNKNSLKRFKTLNTSEEIFNKVIPINKNLKFKIKLPLKIQVGMISFTINKIIMKILVIITLIYYNLRVENNKYNSNKHILFNKGKIILSDEKGNIFIYSLNEKKIIDQFNFYRKKFKKNKKRSQFNFRERYNFYLIILDIYILII